MILIQRDDFPFMRPVSEVMPSSELLLDSTRVARVRARAPVGNPSFSVGVNSVPRDYTESPGENMSGSKISGFSFLS